MQEPIKKTYLITGTAGFIGFHVVKRLLEEGCNVIGVDNLNTYYDVSLKFARLRETGIYETDIEYAKLIKSSIYSNYTFIQLGIEDSEKLFRLLQEENITHICHLAAQAGVRYSIENPGAYVDSNLVGFVNLLELAREKKVNHFVYASSSSVYGLNKKMPFSVHDNVDHPISLYAATKKSNELMAHTYSHLFKIPTTGLRFFTVYGPWGRPDMALFKFTKNILEGSPIDVYNNGNMKRDFTYIDDITNGVIRVLEHMPIENKNWNFENPDPSSSPRAPYKIYNIGNSKPVSLGEFIAAIENCTGKKAVKNMLPIQPGDVEETFADISDIKKDTGYVTKTDLQEGIIQFVNWYKNFYKYCN
ncbi:MAG: NAD-dependent epimerase [Spirochaetia bacterium]|nr:NAD-dependent epimerase [Spirochaetia bacterium]